MATGQVKKLNDRNGKLVHVTGLGNRPMWSEVFENNPRLIRSKVAGCNVLVNGPNVRPYVESKTSTRWFWRKWERLPGELYFTEEEKRFAIPFAGRILIEPNTKVLNGNKSWQWSRWEQLVAGREKDFVQVGAASSRALSKVLFVPTTFRQAAAILSRSKGFVGTEGALHHAAAALGIPAVVLWSEFISPDITGYDGQVNIRHAGEPCGSRIPCKGCLESMSEISVSEVDAGMRKVLP